MIDASEPWPHLKPWYCSFLAESTCTAKGGSKGADIVNGFITITIIISGGVDGFVNLFNLSHDALRLDKMSEVGVPLCMVMMFMVTSRLVHEQWCGIVMRWRKIDVWFISLSALRDFTFNLFRYLAGMERSCSVSRNSFGSHRATNTGSKLQLGLEQERPHSLLHFQLIPSLVTHRLMGRVTWKGFVYCNLIIWPLPKEISTRCNRRPILKFCLSLEGTAVGTSTVRIRVRRHHRGNIRCISIETWFVTCIALPIISFEITDL